MSQTRSAGKLAAKAEDAEEIPVAGGGAKKNVAGGGDDDDDDDDDEYKNKRRESKRAKKIITTKDRFQPGQQDLPPPTSKSEKPKSKRKRTGAKRAVVIGAGMAGLAAARELEKMKYEVTVLEARQVGAIAFCYNFLWLSC
jgi:hypothetical protein